MRLLLAEDERALSKALATILERSNYSVDTVYDGEAALEYLAADNYDGVILDIMMPKLDGFGVCELIRRQSRVPIVLLTALDGEAEQLRGFDLEIDDYITKPFSMPILLRKLAAVLRRARTLPALPGADPGPRRGGGTPGRPGAGAAHRPGV